MAVGGDPMRTPVKLFEPIAEFGRRLSDWDTDSEDDMHNEYIPPGGVTFGASPPLIKKVSGENDIKTQISRLLLAHSLHTLR